MAYQVKLEHFEGPLDLLLELIQQQQLDITRLSLAQITEQYLEYLEQKDTISLENLAQFLSVAAKLILIKSKALLPLLEFSDEEEEEIKDLEQQLLEYRKFKDAAKQLASLFGGRRVFFTREVNVFSQSVFLPPRNVDVLVLQGAFLRVLTQIEIPAKLEEEMLREVITLEEKIIQLQEIVSKKVETSFSEVVAKATDKVEVVVAFLAMLEMVKQRIIRVAQAEIFGEIKLSKHDHEEK